MAEQKTEPTGMLEKANAFLPAAVVGPVYSAFHKDISISNPEDIKTFLELHKKLLPICGPDAQDLIHLPSVRACWEYFSYKQLNNRLLIIKNVASVKNFIDQYRTNKKDYPDHPFVAMVLERLGHLEQLEEHASQNIAKIILSYFASVTVKLCSLNIARDALQERQIISHLANILTIIRNDALVRMRFKEATQLECTKLHTNIEKYLIDSQSVTDVQIIPTAIAQFSRGMFQTSSTLCKLLLILTEGGNRKNLTFEYEAMSNFAYSKDNPMQYLIIHAAQFIPTLHTQAVRDYSLDTYVPNLEAVQNYITTAASTHRFLGLNNPNVSHFLLQKPNPRNDAIMVYVKDEDKVEIRQSSEHLIRLAHWLEFWLFVSHNIFNLNTLLTLDGQRWISEGDESEFFVAFIKRLQEFLRIFQSEIENLERFFGARILSNRTAYEHNIFVLLTTIKDQVIYVDQAIMPLLEVKAIADRVDQIRKEVRAQTFSTVKQILASRRFFDASGPELPKLQSLKSTAQLSIMPASRVQNIPEDDKKNVQQNLSTNFPVKQSAKKIQLKTSFPTWAKALITFGIACLVFGIVATVFYTGGASLPLFFQAFGLLNGSLIVAGLAAIASILPISFVMKRIFRHTSEPAGGSKVPLEPNPFMDLVQQPLISPQPQNSKVINYATATESAVPKQATTEIPIDVSVAEGRAIVVAQLINSAKEKFEQKFLPLDKFENPADLARFIKDWANACKQNRNMAGLNDDELENCIIKALQTAIEKNVIEVNSPKSKEKILENLAVRLQYKQIVSNQSIFKPATSLAPKQSASAEYKP